MISGWKRAAIKSMADGFGKDAGGTAKEAAAEIDKLHSKIGQPAGGTGFFSERLGSIARGTRQKMVSRNQILSVRRQCKLLSLVRSGFYYSPKGERAENLKFMKIIDMQFLETPWYGSRPPLVVCKQTPAGQWTKAANSPAMNLRRC